MFADNWCIKANERVYGPYSSKDLKKFAHEGRFAAWSIIAPAGSRDWREARKHQPTEQIGPANFVIVFDTVNAAASRVENALSSLGTAFRLAENVWTVNCALTAIGVRNALAPFLRAHETLFVVDATNGRTSWQNYAPEAHSKITQAFVHARR